MSGDSFASKPSDYVRKFLDLWWIPLMEGLGVSFDAYANQKPFPAGLVVASALISLTMAGLDYSWFVRKEKINPAKFSPITQIIIALSAFVMAALTVSTTPRFNNLYSRILFDFFIAIGPIVASSIIVFVVVNLAKSKRREQK